MLKQKIQNLVIKLYILIKNSGLLFKDEKEKITIIFIRYIATLYNIKIFK